jgi:hypothetical protein
MADSGDLDLIFSVGYYLIRRENSEFWRGPKPLLPDALISLSRCVCPLQLDVVWGWQPQTDYIQIEKRAFGIPAELSADFDAWSTERGQNDPIWPMFPSVASMRHFAARFQLQIDDYALIGVGRPRDLGVPSRDLFGTWDESFDAIWNERPVSLEFGGTALGYEITSFDYGDFGHSWLCSGLQHDMHDLFGIIPNVYGLIDTLDEALKVHEWIAEDEMRGGRAEPEPYFPWLLVSYPLMPP